MQFLYANFISPFPDNAYYSSNVHKFVQDLNYQEQPSHNNNNDDLRRKQCDIQTIFHLL